MLRRRKEVGRRNRTPGFRHLREHRQGPGQASEEGRARTEAMTYDVADKHGILVLTDI